MPKSEFTAEIGTRIRAAREQQRLTRERLAEMAGISVQFLSDIERGAKSMTTSTFSRVVRALHLSADYVLFGQTGTERNNFSAMLEQLPPHRQVQAEELLLVFLRALEYEQSAKKKQTDSAFEAK